MKNNFWKETAIFGAIAVMAVVGLGAAHAMVNQNNVAEAPIIYVMPETSHTLVSGSCEQLGLANADSGTCTQLGLANGESASAIYL